MTGIRSYSTTAANNNAAPPNGMPENQPASTVNDTVRQIMADIREAYEDQGWIDYGDTPTRIDNDTITVPGNLVTRYAVGRRIRLIGATTGYGTITASVFGAVTTIDVRMDSGNVPSSLSMVALGIANDAGNILPYYQRTAAEKSAAVTPTDYTKAPGDFLRYGAVSGGSAATNSTAINNALLSNSWCFCNDAGTYTVSAQLLVQSNQTIRMAQGVTIKASAAGVTGGVILKISECENVQVYGGVIDGNKAGNAAGTLFGVQILNSDGVRIFGTVSQNCPSDNVTLGAAGDGFYVGGFAGGSPGSSNVELHGCYSLNNVRQGLSLVRCDGVSVIGGKYSGTTGDSPGAGIDVEANPGLGVATNIHIVGVELSDNELGIVLTEGSHNVTITGCTILRSRAQSMILTDVINATITGNIIQAQQTISNAIIDMPGAQYVTFSNNVINGEGAASSFEGAAIRLAIASNDVTITNNLFRSIRGQALALGNGSSTGVPTNINFSDNTLIDCLDPVSSPARGSIAIGGNTGTAQFPLLATIRNNLIRDTRGTPADYGITLTNIPAATSAEYRIDGNRIEGPVTPFIDNVATVPPLCGLVTWNPASLLDGAGETSPNITVLGAALGDAVDVYTPYSLQGFLCTGYVSATDTVNIRIQNESTATVDLASGSWRVRVKKLFEL